MWVSRKSFRIAKRLAVTVGLLSFAGIVTERLGLLDVLTAWRRLATLEREKRELLDYAQRLCASRKTAQVDVLGQEPDSTGRIATRLRWTEFDDSAVAKPPRELTVFGKQVFFEAFVIKFQHRLIGNGDPEKGWRSPTRPGCPRSRPGFPWRYVRSFPSIRCHGAPLGGA